MEKSFDFGRLLKNHEKKHKNKPTQFVSVAGGVQKRLENNLKSRKSNRLTIFDSIRNLSRCASPAPLSAAQQKIEHRKQQLEMWKVEKQKKKKEAASQKKKPFVTGIAHAPLKFVPPPPAPVRPSTSGRVTRSQSARIPKQIQEKQTLSQSFAPKNASFKPPLLKNIPKLPYVSLVPLKQMKNKKTTITFDPVLPKSTQDASVAVKQTQSRAQNKPVETKASTKANNAKTKGKITNPVLKINAQTLQSSSSSETDSIKSAPMKSRKSVPAPQSPAYQSSSESDPSSQSPVLPTKQSPPNTRTRKSLPDSPMLTLKTPRKSTRKSLDPKQFTPKNPVPKSESSSEERLRSPKSPLELPVTPEQIVEEMQKISPCVTISRGKDNARREMKKKLNEGLLDEDACDIDNIDHFRRQLASEIKRMTEMCEKWDRILEQTVLPESIQECILGAVGQARLLMSQKLQQFASLVERCARPEPGAALVTPADLLGFWDMLFMQVENIDMRFLKLEALSARGWREEPESLVQKAKPVKVLKPKPVAGASRIKDMIAAARKAKKEQLPVMEKTFEAGFFCVTSPVRAEPSHARAVPSPARTVPSPAPRTPLANHTLLKAVLSNEAKKSASKNSASFAMLRASVLGKNVECDGVALLPQTPLSQIQINATPGRSILKLANTAHKSAKKSIKVVLFDKSDSESSDTEKQQPLEVQKVLEEQEKVQDEEKVLEEQEKVLKEQEIVENNLSSTDVEKENKNSRRKSHRLLRQDATEERSPVMTRSRRKSIATPQEQSTQKARRSTRNSKVLEDVQTNVIVELTPKRNTRRKQVGVLELTA